MKAKPLLPGYHYHIFGRGINGETIFRTREDFVYFLDLYKERFHPLVDTFAYCLMRNHYHFQVRVKDEDDGDLPPTDPRGTAGESPQHPAGHPANVAFGRLLMAYAKRFNFKYRWTGGLFESPFGRKHVHSDAYFSRLVVYIHRNPVEAGFVMNPSDWRWSSYNAIVSQHETLVKRDTVLEWFGEYEHFVLDHNTEIVEDNLPGII